MYIKIVVATQGTKYLMYLGSLKVGLSMEVTEAGIAQKVPYVAEFRNYSGVKVSPVCDTYSRWICGHECCT